MPSAYETFLATGALASAALIGLLFVAISISPAQVFGNRAAAEHQLLALSAFTALANAFFLSFAGLLPMPHVGLTAIVLAALALSETLALLFLQPTWRRNAKLLRGLSIFAVSAAVYVYELVLGVALARTASDLSILSQLLGLLLGIFALGLLRSWQLLGAPYERSLVSQLRALLLRQDHDATAHSDGRGGRPSGGRGPTEREREGRNVITLLRLFHATAISVATPSA